MTPSSLTLVKLPVHRAGLPGKEEVWFFVAPLIPACKAGLAGCASGQNQPLFAGAAYKVFVKNQEKTGCFQYYFLV
jgi:hypothetical protein